MREFKIEFISRWPLSADQLAQLKSDTYFFLKAKSNKEKKLFSWKAYYLSGRRQVYERVKLKWIPTLKDSLLRVRKPPEKDFRLMITDAALRKEIIEKIKIFEEKQKGNCIKLHSIIDHYLLQCRAIYDLQTKLKQPLETKQDSYEREIKNIESELPQWKNSFRTLLNNTLFDFVTHRQVHYTRSIDPKIEKKSKGERGIGDQEYVYANENTLFVAAKCPELLEVFLAKEPATDLIIEDEETGSTIFHIISFLQEKADDYLKKFIEVSHAQQRSLKLLVKHPQFKLAYLLQSDKETEKLPFEIALNEKKYDLAEILLDPDPSNTHRDIQNGLTGYRRKLSKYVDTVKKIEEQEYYELKQLSQTSGSYQKLLKQYFSVNRILETLNKDSVFMAQSRKVYFLVQRLVFEIKQFQESNTALLRNTIFDRLSLLSEIIGNNKISSHPIRSKMLTDLNALFEISYAPHCPKEIRAKISDYKNIWVGKKILPLLRSVRILNRFSQMALLQNEQINNFLKNREILLQRLEQHYQNKLKIKTEKQDCLTKCDHEIVTLSEKVLKNDDYDVIDSFIEMDIRRDTLTNELKEEDQDNQNLLDEKKLFETEMGKLMPYLMRIYDMNASLLKFIRRMTVSITDREKKHKPLLLECSKLRNEIKKIDVTLSESKAIKEQEKEKLEDEQYALKKKLRTTKKTLATNIYSLCLILKYMDSVCDRLSVIIDIYYLKPEEKFDSKAIQENAAGIKENLHFVRSADLQWKIYKLHKADSVNKELHEIKLSETSPVMRFLRYKTDKLLEKHDNLLLSYLVLKEHQLFTDFITTGVSMDLDFKENPKNSICSKWFIQLMLHTQRLVFNKYYINHVKDKVDLFVGQEKFKKIFLNFNNSVGLESKTVSIATTSINKSKP